LVLTNRALQNLLVEELGTNFLFRYDSTSIPGYLLFIPLPLRRKMTQGEGKRREPKIKVGYD